MLDTLISHLTNAFSEEDLKTLCLTLQVDYESLPAVGKAGKARELVSYLQRRDRLDDLCRIGRRERPHLTWPSDDALRALKDARHAARTQTAPELLPYLETVAKGTRYLPIVALDPAGKLDSAIALGEVFVGLNVVGGQRERAREQGDDAAGRAALADIHARSRLILLGDPGSGKSTLLKFIAHCLAMARLQPEVDWPARLAWQEDDQPAHWTLDRPLPLLIELRHFARSTFDPASPLALWEYACALLRKNGLACALPALEEQMQAGNLIFLLDGVDEVPPERRQAVWQVIASVDSGVCVRNRWLATCRVLSFHAPEAPAGVAAQTLLPFNAGQIKQFVTGWYGTLAEVGSISADEAAQHTRSLQSAVQRPNLQALAANPMLLTIMALVQSYYGTLPDERAQLYQMCVDTLLLRWQRRKETPEGDELPDLLAQLDVSRQQLARLLWEIAWKAHSESDDPDEPADIAEIDVVQIGREQLGSYAKAEQFLAYTEERAHLLVGRGGVTGRVYTFPHRTFQEYLAACRLAAGRRFPQEAAKLAAAGSGWREVLNLAAGTLVFNQNNREKALDGVAGVLPRALPDAADSAGWLRVWMAAEMLLVVGVAAAEQDDVGQEVLPRVREMLAALVAGGRLTPQQRAEAGVTLGWLGDPRAEVACDVPFLVDIPAGPFWMGSNRSEDKLAYDDEEPKHQVTLPAYRIGKYPVTVAQYGRFMAAGGYEQRTFWTDDGWRQKEQEGWTQPRYWDEKQWTCPNHPVVGVSWYEALAYCRWLAAETGKRFRLPDEAMWEKAARGVDGRVYPWGDAWDAEKLNANATGIGQTTAVGSFPDGASPFGLLDAGGNVWEWCSNPGYNQTRYPFAPRTWAEHEKELAGTQQRALRGGAWSNLNQNCRAAYRSGLNPHLRLYYGGFRVAEHLSDPGS